MRLDMAACTIADKCRHASRHTWNDGHAEAYADRLSHSESHRHYWSTLQRLGTVPPDVEDERPPRGRVALDMNTKRFALYADRCILNRIDVLSEIINTMCLPELQTIVGSDGPFGHYQC
jgi:hypothetical protein